MRASHTVSNIADTAQKAASDSADHLRAAGHVAVEGVRNIGEAAAEAVNGSVRQAADRVVSDATRLGSSSYNAVAAAADKSASSLESMVNRNPMGALIAALGVGLVLGLMARKQ